MDWAGGEISSANSRDHSSTGMHPPSMYDTSVSSKSSNSHRRFPTRGSPPPSRYTSHAMMMPQKESSSSRERPVVVYPSRSMDNSSYACSPRYRSSVAAMSDPGGPMVSPSTPKLMETQSDVGYSPTNTNSSSMHRYNNHSNSFATTTSSQETRPMTGGRASRYQHHGRNHSYTGGNNNYNNNGNVSTRSSTLRSHSLSGRSGRNVMPPMPKETVLQPQLSASGSWGSPNRRTHAARNHARAVSRNPPSLYRVEDQELGHQHSTFINHNDSDINSSARIETPSPVNVRELKRQLWNEQEVLQVPSSSAYFVNRSVDYDDYPQQTVPSLERPDPSRCATYDAPPFASTQPHSSPPHRPSFANSRYARSLSPARRRQHLQSQQSSPSDPHQQQQPHKVPYASSAISDNSTNRFHSKFYEAALVARMRGKVAPPSSASIHSRPFDERSQQIPQQSSLEHLIDHSPSIIRPVDAVDRQSASSSIQQKRQSISESPTSQQVDERATIDTLNQHQQRYQASRYSNEIAGVPPADRGRSMDPPRRRTRAPSPMIQDRIRSLSQDPQNRVHQNNFQRNSPPNDPRNESFQPTIGRFGSIDEGSRGMPVTAAAERTPKMDNETGTTHQQPRPAYLEERYGSKLAASAMESSKERMTQLMVRLHSVNRDNPEVALAQIDQILRQESHTSAPVRSGTSDHGGTPQQHEFAMTATIPPFPPKEDSNAEADDDDSDVSSITNPTYQGTSTAKQYFDRVRVVSPQDKAPPAESSSSTQENEPVSPGAPFSPSTSSFRRPRPSHLQNYTTASAFQSRHPSDLFAVGRFPKTIQNEQVESSNDVQPSTFMKVSDRNTSMDAAFPENPFDDFILPEPPQKMAPQDIDFTPLTEHQQQTLEPPPKQPPLSRAVSGEITRSKEQRQQLLDESIIHQTKVEVSLASPSPIPSTEEHEPKSDAVVPHVGSIGKTGKLDKFISDKDALARKIQAWDSLSNSIVQSEAGNNVSQNQVDFSDQKSLALPRPPTNASRRHPWDGRVPSRMENIRMRDTSMDEAIGIETEMTIRTGVRELSAGAYRIEAESPQFTASVDASVPGTGHFKLAGENIRDRAEEYIPVDPVYHINEKVVEEKKVADEEAMRIPDIPIPNFDTGDVPKEVTSDNKNLTRNVTTSPDGVVQFSPNNQSHSQQLSSQGRKSEDSEEESSWVSLPKNPFFTEFKSLNPFAESDTKPTPTIPKKDPPTTSPPPTRDVDAPVRSAPPPRSASDVNNRASEAPSKNSRSRDGPPNAGPVDLDDYTFGVSPCPSMDQSGEQAEIEVALNDPKKYIGKNNNGVAMSRSGARSLACQTVPNKEVMPTKEKKKGFLRAFIERKKMKAAGSATVGHEPSAAAQSTSLDSRGAKSASQLGASRNERFVPSTPVTPGIHLIPPPPGVMDRRALTPNRGRRGHRNSSSNNSTRRSRSNSLERFRTPSMAQKFNRVMKLYDD